MPSSTWYLSSWKTKKNSQPIVYPSQQRLHKISERLHHHLPIVTPAAIEQLKADLQRVATGQAFLFQAGDCAEQFSDCQEAIIRNKIDFFIRINEILHASLKIPIIHVARIAGQYAKPRSNLYESRQAIKLPTYKGDLINSPDFVSYKRIPNPFRMLVGYQKSFLTVSWIKQILAELNSPLSFYTSHEALNLYYETALTRQIDHQWYNLATHFPWIGMRTNQRHEAHCEYIRGLANPFAVKIGPHTSPEKLVQLIKWLNPANLVGKLVLITRLGDQYISKVLPSLIKAVHQKNLNVVWSCDPMHGNTVTTTAGIKTRHFDHIVNELQTAFTIHHQLDSILGGIHIELTAAHVRECLGGPSKIEEKELISHYQSLVDPRLNYQQSLELITALSAMFPRPPAN